MQSSIAGAALTGEPVRIRQFRPLLAVAAGCCLVVLEPGAARAADAVPDESTTPAAPLSLQEIVVTANRREENLSKVPISVSAYTQATMDSMGIKDFTDIARFTPGVQIDAGQTNAISIRGISSSGGAGTTGIYIDDTPIQIRALGFNPDDTLPKTFDLDRVEVLRGPQGTLFGAGSEGGTVRYIMTQPSLTKTSGYARAELSYTAGGEPSYEAGVAYGMPIIDGTLGFRASAWYRRDGGWIDRVKDSDPNVDPDAGHEVVDSNSNHDETTVLRAAAIWAPTSSLTVTPSFIYQNRQRHDTSYFWKYGSIYSDPSSDRFVSANPTNQSDPDKYYLASIKVQADLGPVQLFSNSAYYERRDISGYDGTLYNLSYYQTLGWTGGYAYDEDGNLNQVGPGETSVPGRNIAGLTPAAGAGIFSYDPSAPNNGTNLPCSIQGFTCYPLLDASGVHLPAALADYTAPATVKNNQSNFSEEIRLQSSDANAPFVWSVGGFWSLNKTYSMEEIHDPEVDAFFNYVFGDTLGDLAGVYVDDDGNTILPYGNDIYFNQIVAFDRQLAGFADLTLRGDLVGLPQGLKLNVGARYSQTDYSFRSVQGGAQNFGDSSGQGEEHEHPITERVSLSYQFTPSDMVYATYSTGFRIGGANSKIPYDPCQTDFQNFGLPDGNPESYSSDKVKNFEVGTKDTIAGRVRIAASAYYIKWSNIQQTVYLPTCALQYVANVGEAVSKGADLQLDFAATDNLTFQSAVGYNSSYYTSTVLPGANSTDADGNAILPLANKGDAIVGESGTPNAPWTITVGAEYRFHLFDHSGFVRLDYEHETRNNRLTAAEDPNTAVYQNCSTDSADVVPCVVTPSSTTFVSARAGMDFGGWNVSLFADNLFDTHVITNYNRQGVDSFGPTIGDTGAAVATQMVSYMTYRPRTIGITATYRY